MRRRWLGWALAASVAATVLMPATPSLACTSFHGAVYLRDFAGGPHPNFVPSSFYAALEGQNVPARVAPMPGCGDIGEGGSSRATYQTEQGTATAGDYTHRSATTGPMCDDIDDWAIWCDAPRWEDIPIPTASDGIAEAAIETFSLRLTAGDPFGVSAAHPNPVPVYLVDLNGSPRSTLEPGTGSRVYRHVEAGQMRMPVFLAGPSLTSVSFTLSGEGQSPATPGQDFTCDPACPGGSGSVPVSATQRVGFIRILFNNDGVPEPDERIRLTLDAPTPVETTSTVIEIDDLSDQPPDPPRTRFHHPKQGRKYRFGDYRLREMHTFVDFEGVAGIDVVQLALRRKKKNGRCAWWNGRKFRPGKCGARRWVPMTYEPSGDLYLYRMKPLRPTVGTKIRNYRAWTRGIDQAGNTETRFVKGRNLSTFKVKRR